MATLDVRIFSLLETLTGSGAGWLASELTEIISAERLPDEAPEVLARARSSVRERQSGERAPFEDTTGISADTDMTGDEQITFVIEYVSRRLVDTLSMLEGALNELGTILGRSRPDAEVESIAAASDVTLVLQDGESLLGVDRTGLTNALSTLQVLLSALDNWAETVRTERL